MSIEVMALVWSRKVGGPSKKSVLACMADAANPDGSRVFLSKPTMAKKCEIHKDTVTRCLKSFLKDGLITKAGKHKIANGYTQIYNLNLIAILALASIDADDADGAQNAPPENRQGGTMHPDRGAPCTPNRP